MFVLEICAWFTSIAAVLLLYFSPAVFPAGLKLAIGQALIMLVRPLWAPFVIALIFVVPAVSAGFNATLGSPGP